MAEASVADLAIIIVSYNTCDLLHACLLSVYSQQAGLSVDVWVVDNASSDDSPEMIKHDFPQVHLLLPGENLGFAAGNNLALRTMGFPPEETTTSSEFPTVPDFVLFLNPDTELQADSLHHLVEFLRSSPATGVVGASLVYANGDFQHSAFRFPTLWQIWFDFFSWPGRYVDSGLNGRYPQSLYDDGKPFAIDHPLGAAMLTRSEVIRQVGLMDEDFFMYAEEIDWCMRVKNSGWQIHCVPTAKIIHHGGGSTQQIQVQMNLALWHSRFRLFQKHYSPAFNSAARLISQLGRWAVARRAPDREV